jgi:RNA-binding protein NOB1
VEGKDTEEDQNPHGDMEAGDNALESLEQAFERLDVELVPLNDDDSQGQTSITPTKDASYSDPSHADVPSSSSPPLYDDPVGEDDGEGEWITPENVTLHKARAVGLAPSENGPVKGKKGSIPVGCMTADFAMQNILLQMDLSLVGMEGKRIQKVKTWVLRCHACFKCVRHLSVPLSWLTPM